MAARGPQPAHSHRRRGLRPARPPPAPSLKVTTQHAPPPLGPPERTATTRPARGSPFRGNRSCHASSATPPRVSRWLPAPARHSRVAQGSVWGSRPTARRHWPPHPPALSRPTTQTTHGQLGARFPWVRRTHSFTPPPLPHPLSCTHRPVVRVSPPPSRHPDGCDFDSGRGGGTAAAVARKQPSHARGGSRCPPPPLHLPRGGGGVNCAARPPLRRACAAASARGGAQ